jgi:hypothetical protein
MTLSQDNDKILIKNYPLKFLFRNIIVLIKINYKFYASE